LWSAHPELRDKLLPYAERAKTYRDDCGCSMGSVFLAGALVVLTVRGLFCTSPVQGHWPAAFVRCAGIVFVAGVVGKAAGIGLARVRLGLLNRQLRRRFEFNED
jgi:hypothetical protein